MSVEICPKCKENYSYQEGHLYICPMCFHEWTEEDYIRQQEAMTLRDVNGNVIEDGSDASIAMDLKLGSQTIKQGTRVKNIKILDEDHDGHDIQGKIDQVGTIYLKSSVIKIN